jgi:hypothetical protein
MADTSKGFRYRGRLCGKKPHILNLVAVSAATYNKGDMLTLSSGEVEITATNDSAILGVCLETKACTGVASTGTKLKVITDADAIYGVYDANARLAGDTIDVSGTTGAMTVTSPTNADFTVVAPSSATEETLVMITHGEHAFN